MIKPDIKYLDALKARLVWAKEELANATIDLFNNLEDRDDPDAVMRLEVDVYTCQMTVVLLDQEIGRLTDERNRG